MGISKCSRLAINALALSGLAACGSNGQVTAYLYTVGGTVAGLTAGGLVLTNVDGDMVSPAAGATTFTFPTSVALGVAYAVSVTTQPSGQTCAVTANGQATVTANVTSIVVTCMDGTVTAVNSKTTPSARIHASAWTDESGSLWMFGGTPSVAAVSSQAPALGDLWKFDAGQQNWLAVSTSGVHPSARAAAATAVGADGDLVMFGGVAMQGATDGTAVLGDFWEFSPDKGVWTRLEAAAPAARGGAAAWSDASGNFWLFGGSGDPVSMALLDDFWSYSPGTKKWTEINGTSRPSARQGARYWSDASGNFWLFGGTTGTTVDDELWEFNIAARTWTLVNQAADDQSRLRLSGPSLASAASTNTGCGTAAQPPAGLTGAATWEGGDGDVWLFGGSVGGTPCDTLWHWAPRPR